MGILVSNCTSFPFLCNGGSALFPFSITRSFSISVSFVDNVKKSHNSPNPCQKKKRKNLQLLCAVLGKKPQKILHYNSNIKWKSLLLSAPLMPPNQHVMGGCNQIISLRFGFPNSFPKLPSADRSLAFRMRGERWREANDLRRNLNNRRREEKRLRWCVGGTFNLHRRETRM